MTSLQDATKKAAAQQSFEPTLPPPRPAWRSSIDILIDDGDPDANLTQIEHLLQTPEAMRRGECPRQMILTGFIHCAQRLQPQDSRVIKATGKVIRTFPAGPSL